MTDLRKLHLLKAREIASLVNLQQLTATECTHYFLARATELNPKLNAFNQISGELALKQATAVDKRIKEGEKLPLAGVPIAIKDNINVKGLATTCSSKILAGYISPYEATVTERLWAAGAICIGKTNLDEFAMGSSTEHSAFGPSLNPWNLNKVPGGSSGGSAVAVAAHLVPLALGSDTGGSIRQPASFCGIAGFKPTYGMVSRYGLVAFASSLDQIGPFAQDVQDLLLCSMVIAGHDPRDSTSSKDIAALSLTEPKIDLKGLKVGIIEGLSGFSAPVEACFAAFKETLVAQGAEFKTLSMPLSISQALNVYYIVAPSEASSNLSRFDGVRYGLRGQGGKDLNAMYETTRQEGFGAEVKRRIMIGSYALSAGYYDAYYKKALQVRKAIGDEFAAAFAEVDLILSPTSPFTAFDFGSKSADPTAMYLCDIATIPVSLAGLPSLSINAGFDPENLPIGMQLTAAAFQDQQLLAMAKACEELLASTLIGRQNAFANV